MKAEENPRVCCSIAIKAVTTPVKPIDNYYGVAGYDKALAAEEIAGTMRPPSDFLGALKPSGCQDRATSHLRLASARSRNTLLAITIATGRISITAGYHH